MTTDPAPSAAGRVLARPFPAPGPLVLAAYRDLATAAHGRPEEVAALGDQSRLPRPWDPPTCRGELRAQVWAWLDAVVAWVNVEYTWEVTAAVPGCWPRHPHLVHEIAVLADQRRRAGAALTSDLLEDWHRYSLPAFTDRLRARVNEHCDQGHQPWPGRGRAARHHDQDEHRRRDYAADLTIDRTDHTGPGHGAASRPPRFGVVDRETGEIT